MLLSVLRSISKFTTHATVYFAFLPRSASTDKKLIHFVVSLGRASCVNRVPNICAQFLTEGERETIFKSIC